MISRSIISVCEDFINIENYEEAINDKTQTWICHHKLETEMNVSAKYLIDNNLYFGRPANELIFLTKKDHQKLHNQHKKFIDYSEYNKDDKNNKPIKKQKDTVYSRYKNNKELYTYKYFTKEHIYEAHKKYVMLCKDLKNNC